MKFINKATNELKPYTYLLKFNINNINKYYYGVRTSNVRNNKLPCDDLFIHYFTSSGQVKKLLNDNIMPYEVIIHKTFNSLEEACNYEQKFLKRVNAKQRKDFLNLTDTINVYRFSTCNIGRVFSQKERQLLSEKSSLIQSSLEYREKRRVQMIDKWKNEDFRKYMAENIKKFKNSDKFIEHKKKKSLSHKGLKESDETKRKKSESMKKIVKNTDMKARMSKRIRYKCPYCIDIKYQKLLGHNFNVHMKKSHNWNDLSVNEFKSTHV